MTTVKPNPHFYPVILAGGRGTRFWPLSRKRSAKQLLALDGKQTMIQQTAARLEGLAPARNVWVVTNDYLRAAILRQLRKIPASQIVAEPVGRNSAPAIGLAAFLLLRRDPDAVVGMFPSDHVIADAEGFRATLRKGIEIAAAGESIVALGVRPTRAETGYGYIEAGAQAGDGSLRVRRFTEKPDLERARQFFEAGNYFWNSGMFIWRADTLASALREHLPSDGRDSGKNCGRLRHTQIRGDVPQALFEMRKYQRRLRGTGAALGEGRRRIAHFLPACGFWMERSGIVDRAA